MSPQRKRWPKKTRKRDRPMICCSKSRLARPLKISLKIFWSATAATPKPSPTPASTWGAAFEAGIKQNFPNAEITFDKFHVIKLANEAVDEVRRQEAKSNFQIKGRRYIFLKNVERLTLEEKEALSRLEAQNLDTIQAMQIRMNLQQLFTMDAKTAPRFLDRWNAWVQVCDLGPMKRLAKTIMAKAEGILRSIAIGLSNGVLEAINGNVQAAKRKAKGYRTKRNLKTIVYLIAGDVLANSPT